MRRLQALFHSCSLRRARLPLRRTSCCRLAVESSDAVETHAAISSLPGTSMPRFFRRSKISTALSKREIPRVMLFRLISSHAVVIKSVWASRPNTRISSGQNTEQCLMRTVSMTQPSESIQTRKSRLRIKSVNAFAIQEPPLCYQSQNLTCGMRRFPALCRQLLSYQKAANFCKRFCKVLHFYDNFLSATNCPSVSLSAWPMGLFTSRVAIPSAGVGCLLMTTRSSPRK